MISDKEDRCKIAFIYAIGEKPFFLDGMNADLCLKMAFFVLEDSQEKERQNECLF